jgi:hypothetical protein
MTFPRCDLYPAEEGFYCQCVGCPIVSNSNASCVIKERKDGLYEFAGKTPNGGVKAVLLFTNDEGEVVAKPDAKHVEIRELDEKGNTVAVQFGVADPQGFYLD